MPTFYRSAVAAAIVFTLSLASDMFPEIAAADAPVRSWELISQHQPRPAGEGRPALLENPAVLEEFVNRRIRDRMEAEHLPAAVFVAILDGEAILKKAWGYQDIEKNIPVDFDTTMFHIASISKTVQGTAIMRMVDKGVLGLDDDVDKLGPSMNIGDSQRFDNPVTIRHTLTHSTGFRDVMTNSSAPPDKFERVRQAIRNYLTPQPTPPGKFVLYCNVCIAMSGGALEDLTDKWYEDVLQEEVFDPLGMKYAVLDIPPNPRVETLDQYMAVGYVWNDTSGQFDRYGKFLRNLYPNSSVAMSAGAMVKYMKMHLNEGKHNGRQFLRPETFREMHSHQASNHELIPGYRITFKEGKQNGVDYYGHSGDYRGNDSTMVFLPDYNFGFFLSYTGDNNTFYRDVITQLIDEAFPSETETFAAPVKTQEELRKYEGLYTNFRFDEPTPMQMVFPLFGQYKATATEDGLLHIAYPSYYFKGGDVTYAQVDEKLFRKVDSGDPSRIGGYLVDYLVFHPSDDGGVYGFSSNIQNHSFLMTKVPWWKGKENFTAILSFTRYGLMTILGIGALLLAWRFLAKVIRKRQFPSSAVGGRAGWAVLGAALTALGFLLAFFVKLQNTLPVNLTYGFDDLGFSPYFVLPLVSLLLFIAAIFLVIRAWRDGAVAPWMRAALTLALAPLATFILIAVKTHLLTYFF